ncbi:hypothetical protein [Thiomicrospira sp. WB1]|uniref:hypothetical protein n=1 Tax=Thiomicrospira sp. WB1 TaxID=1685380 RepID=UPI0007468908|nr:hypothetical protein [Thiomicrospira sp. WB1]KUJ71810.1 hypothetical protein AVO41_04940 [Thiomicrospira sp. WB1]
MNITFDTQVAQTLSMHEAVFLGWMNEHYDQRPLKTQELVEVFDFWKPELVYKVLLRLEERDILHVKRDNRGFCRLSLNPNAYQAQTGQTCPVHATPPVMDDNLKRHLKRFQGTDNLLHQKLSELVAHHSAQMLDYAQQEGLNEPTAKQSLDKFLHYVSADPDRFWNSDLIAYWRFWVSNTLERQPSPKYPQDGKRAQMERSAQHAASTWLKKKSMANDLHTTVPIETGKKT